MRADSTRAPEVATALSTKDDAEIIAAWATYNEARAKYDADPDHGPHVDGMNATQRELASVMAPAENLIGNTVPTTLRGIEVQLWSMLVHTADTQVAATLARTEQVGVCADHFDWIDCHALNAIRAIRALIAKEGGAK